MATMTLTDWAALLLADCSDVNLLGFADWLELDQDDEELAQAARGVRELLVGEGRRPDRLCDSHESSYGWAISGTPDTAELPPEVYESLSYEGLDRKHCWSWYDFGDHLGRANSEAHAHLTALLDAAQAWAKCNPEPLTKGTQTCQK